MKIFVENVGHLSNSILTTMDFDIEEKQGSRQGIVKLMWCKDSGTLVIREVYLSPQQDFILSKHNNSYVVDYASKYILESMPLVNQIIIESPAKYLVQKYKLKHWNFNPEKNELFLKKNDWVFNF